MTKTNQLVQRNVSRYESSRNHVDAMIEYGAESDFETTNGKQDSRDWLISEDGKLFSGIDAYMRRHPEERSEEKFVVVGPMVVWDTIAQQLERLVEHLEH